MDNLVHISLPTAGGYALLGYAVVFFGLVLLMIVIMIMGKIMTARSVRTAVSPAAQTTPATASVTPVPSSEKAKGTAGELKLYNTDPRDAAMIMAIVADSLGRPLNELRFISIREVSEDEI